MYNAGTNINGTEIYRVGVDIGGTNIKVGFVDSCYNLAVSASCKTALPRSGESVCDDVVMLINKIIEESGIDLAQIKAIGIGCPGTVNPESGMVEYANNLGWSKFPLQKYMADKFGNNINIYIANDADAAAVGEFFAGSAKGAKSAVIITLGTGLGSGAIINGKLVTGYYNGGGEVGHMVIEYNGKPCTCGRKGCFETYSSATGLINITKEEMQKAPESLMWRIAESLEGVDGKTAFDAMRQNDKAGRLAVETYINYLACGITNVVNIYQPEIIGIGGGVCNAGDDLLLPLRDIVARDAYGTPTPNTEIKICTLGNDAGIIGAALLGEI